MSTDERTTEEIRERVAEIETEAQGRMVSALDEAGEACYWSDLADTERQETFLEDEDVAELVALRAELLRRRYLVEHHVPSD